MKYRQQVPLQTSAARERPTTRPRHLQTAALPTLAACLLLVLGAAIARPAAAAQADPLLQLAVQQAWLTVGDGAAYDQFGYSVAVDGETAVVGAPYDDVGANANQGSACVFVRSGSTWSFQQRLTATDGAAYDWFGYSVALSGETALVGAPYDDVGANADQGSASVFARSGSTWSLQQQLTATEGAAYDRFGYSVALAGETALVGVPYDDVDANADQGSACVFTRSGSTWDFQQRLTATAGAAYDWFGYSVALSGETALVGAPYDDVGANADQGSASVFARSGSTWSLQQQLTATDGAAYDWFGWSVGSSGDTAVVGARGDDVGANIDQGSASVFTRSGSTWTQQTTLTVDDGAANDRLGYSVALAGETAVVGAPWDDVGASGDRGSACVFTRSGGTWSQRTRLTADDGQGGDLFGYSVALAGETALVGAPLDDVGANETQGSACVFLLDFSAPTTAATFSPPANAAGWHRSAVTVTLTAGDPAPGSGIEKTYYRFGSSGPFAEYDPAAKPVVSGQGTTTVQFYSTDRAGNSETPKSETVQIDSTAPTTAAALSPPANAAGWHRSPVTVTLTASDALSGMSGGDAGTEYSLDGGASWTTGTSATVSAQGTSTLLYRSTDKAGNSETPKSQTVRIDSRKPSTTAWPASVRRGKQVKLGYRVKDAVPGCGQARVTLKIYKGTKLKKTLTVKGPVPCNLKRTQSWRCTLPRGRYTIKVFATDIAGNRQSNVGTAWLTVR